MDEGSDRATMSPASPTDARAMAWHDGLVRRIGICLATILVALLVVALPLPYFLPVSLGQLVLGLAYSPHAGYISDPRPDTGVRPYVTVCLLLAFMLSQPMLLWHALDLTAPNGLPARSARLWLTIVACAVAHFIGAVILALYTFNWLLTWSTTDIIVEPSMLAHARAEVMVTLSFALGFMAELPVLLIGIIWLRIVSRGHLARWRPYAVLVAFIVGAWVTPTPDAINEAVVAIPIYLLYQLGLLLARVVLADRPD